jgi:hypothetical protein
MPMKNGDRRLNGRPGVPIGCSGVLISEATTSAARTGSPVSGWCCDESPVSAIGVLMVDRPFW